MGINFTDFSKAPIQESPEANLFENVLKGYKIEEEPKIMKQNAEQKALANSLQKLALEHKPTEYKLADALAQSRIAKNNRPAGIGGAAVKANGKLANFIVSHPNATQEEVTAFADTLSEAELKHLRQTTTRSETLDKSQAARGMPANEKKWSLAMGRGMGIDPTEMQRELNEGKTVSDVAKERNIPLAEVKPKYGPGEELVKQNQKRDAYTKELSILDRNMSSAMGKYQNKILGYSLDQVADAVSGDDPDTQGKVLAARALQPEMAALRLKMANANIGIESIKELQAKSLGNLKIIESTVDEPTYLAMQKYMNRWLNEASEGFGKAIDANGQITPWGESGSKGKSSGSRKSVYNPATGRLE